eukprot:512749-Alexandrium_andersonii.AAC.1
MAFWTRPALSGVFKRSQVFSCAPGEHRTTPSNRLTTPDIATKRLGTIQISLGCEVSSLGGCPRS